MTVRALPGCNVLPPFESETGSISLNSKLSSKGKSAGRFEDLNSFVDITMQDLTRNEIAVWMVLFRDTKDGIARTSQAGIARRIGANERTVRRVIGKLEGKGLVTVVQRGRLQSGPSSYRVHALKGGEP